MQEQAQMIGQTLNQRYRLDRELGRGGMGAVFQGYDTLLKRVVAVKLLIAAQLDEQAKNDLLAEARAVAQLNHPNIVSVFDAGESEDVPFVVMEFMSGASLHETPPGSVEAAVRSAMQICAALQEAHQHGIIHRDLKPENVIAAGNGLVKLSDFGLAHSLDESLTSESSLSGTLAYLSPEQALGKPLDGRTDLYALGVMLYEFVTGQLPFNADDPVALIGQHLNQRPAPPVELAEDLSPELQDIILKLMAKEPQDRYDSAAQAQDALQAYLDEQQLSAHARVLHNIPLDLTSFIGRENEVEQVRELMRTNRLLTLTGVGGTGKTRLALQAARGLLEDFHDGVWVVELSTIFEPEQVLRAIAGTLDIRVSGNRSLMEALQDYLRPRQLLLVLDNCEHLIRACSEAAGQLLANSPELKIMATSRESLGLAGERNFHVPSMHLPGDGSDLNEASVWQIESMQLFRDRALNVKPDFCPDDSQTRAAARICARLDGIPLAIELAAARVRVMPVEEIAARLSDRFRLLTGGSRTAIPRQQTLEALIDWSYDLLTEPEKVLLRRLSIFAGGWTLSMAEAVCSNEQLPQFEIMDILTRLVDKSLVNSDTRRDEARFNMLETIRQYARNKLIQSGESGQLRDRHLSTLSKLSDRIAPQLWQTDQVHWMDRLEEEHDNIRAALEWSLCEGCEKEHVMLGVHLADNVFLFWLVRGYWSECLDWMRKLQAHPEVKNAQDIDVIRLVYSIGFIIKEMGDLHAARDSFEQALTMARAAQDQRSQGYALLGLGEVAMMERFLEPAKAYIDESLAIFRALNEPLGIALTLSRKGGLASDSKGDYEEAKKYYQENLKICRDVGHILGIAGTLMALGRIEMYHGDAEIGRGYLQESLSIFRESRDKSGIAGALSAIGYADLYADNLESSRESYEEVLRINRELRSSPGIGSALIALGEIHRWQGNYDTAREYYEEALELNADLGQVGIVIVVGHNLGYVAKQQNDLPQALVYFRRSLRLAYERGVKRFIYYCLMGIAGVYSQQERWEDSLRLFGASEALSQQNTYTLDPVDQVEVRRSLEKIEKEVPPERRAQLRAEGSQLSLAQAISLAEEDYGTE
jgi:non-specific serine/threonine protein kinase